MSKDHYLIVDGEFPLLLIYLGFSLALDAGGGGAALTAWSSKYCVLIGWKDMSLGKLGI